MRSISTGSNHDKTILEEGSGPAGAGSAVLLIGLEDVNEMIISVKQWRVDVDWAHVQSARALEPSTSRAITHFV